jgi:hypothetical protein
MRVRMASLMAVSVYHIHDVRLPGEGNTDLVSRRTPWRGFGHSSLARFRFGGKVIRAAGIEAE